MNGPTLVDGDNVVFIDRKEREYLRPLRAGHPVRLRNGSIDADDLIGQPEGRYIRSSAGEPFLVLRPTYADLIPNLPRRAQVIYPKDIGPILLWGDIFPGAKVIEVGTGPGALTMALLRAIGPEGSLISYEIRDDFATMARENVDRFMGPQQTWTIKLRDARDGFDETDIDRLTIDMSEPWLVVDGAARALRPGGVLLAYIPTVLQVKQLADTLAAHRLFGAVRTFESFLRTWHVTAQSVRPDHRMVAHTGFITVARRLATPD